MWSVGFVGLSGLAHESQGLPLVGITGTAPCRVPADGPQGGIGLSGRVGGRRGLLRACCAVGDSGSRAGVPKPSCRLPNREKSPTSATIVTALIKATLRIAWIAVATGAIDQPGSCSVICRVSRSTRRSASVTESM
jgi:hypothetical protein